MSAAVWLAAQGGVGLLARQEGAMPEVAGEVLVVDDDPHLREVVVYALQKHGFEVREAEHGEQALEMVRASEPDLMVLDVFMPRLDGLETCRAVRQFSEVPIVFLSSRDEEIDRVLGLELGGDDYISKPFSTRELVSRVKAILRRTRRAAPAGVAEAPAAPPASGDLTVGSLVVRPEAHQVWCEGNEVRLTATEFRLLLAFMGQPGRVFTREDLGRAAYEDGRFVSARTVDSHVRGVRAKLRAAGLTAIETVHGVGYRLGLT